MNENGPGEIGESQREALIAAAVAVRKHAYAPYSNFDVGAAILTSDGRIFAGCNIENASYGLTICAERVAIGSAVASGGRVFSAIAIVTPRGNPPCGACRQALAEFCDDLPILLVAADDDAVRRTSLGEMFPDSFTLGCE